MNWHNIKHIVGDGDSLTPYRSDRRMYMIVSNGLRTEVCESEPPEWATLVWFLKDDPRGRPDWSRLRGYHPEKFNKLSKSDLENT